LNSAFAKLIADLGVTASSATTATSAAPANSLSSSAASGGASGTSASPQPNTTPLQAFLSSFLQNLESSAGNTWSPRGNGVNVSA